MASRCLRCLRSDHFASGFVSETFVHIAFAFRRHSERREESLFVFRSPPPGAAWLRVVCDACGPITLLAALSPKLSCTPLLLFAVIPSAATNLFAVAVVAAWLQPAICFFVRARLQPCRKALELSAALAAEGLESTVLTQPLQPAICCFTLSSGREPRPVRVHPRLFSD